MVAASVEERKRKIARPLPNEIPIEDTLDLGLPTVPSEIIFNPSAFENYTESEVLEQLRQADSRRRLEFRLPEKLTRPRIYLQM